MRALIRVAGTALVLVSLSSHALAQDVEPNNNCVLSPSRTPLPSSFGGSIDEVDADVFTDVDFYAFSAPSGSAFRLSFTSTFTAGIFDDSCRLLLGSSGPANVIDFEVPESGNVTIGIGDLFDAFKGAGASNAGPYEVRIDPQPPVIGSISGRLVDARTRGPAGFAFLELQRCTSGFCRTVSRVDTDATGRFRFERDEDQVRIGPGTFQVQGTPSRYALATSGQFEVGAGEHVDVELVAEPPPIQISNIRPCAPLGSRGGVCAYSMEVRNNTDERLSALARSIVRGQQRTTSFEASVRGRSGVDVRRAPLDIAARSGQTVTFSFEVPAAVQDGTTVCTDLLVGRQPSPLVNLASQEQRLFCVTKGIAGATAR